MQNSDLISRSALLEFARNHVGGVIDCNDIARFPLAAAEPVRHGRWIHDINNLFGCSECMERTTMSFRTGLKNYCPNCGAKMDAEVEG